MAEQNQAENFFADLKQKIEAYIQDRVLLLKLQTTKQVSRLITVLFIGLIVLFILLFIILFLSIAAGFYFSNLTHNTFYGFGIVAVIYLLLFFVIIGFRKVLIVKQITTLIIKILFDK